MGVRMQRTRTPIFLRLGNRTPRFDDRAGSIRGVLISDIVADGAVMTSTMAGIPGSRSKRLRCPTFVDTVEKTSPEWATLAVPEQAKAYPEARMFEHLPAYRLYCHHVYGLRLHNLSFASSITQATPPLPAMTSKALKSPD